MSNRNLSGIYFRQKNDEGGFDNVCFEELRPEEQQRVMEGRSEEWLKSLAVQLGEVVCRLGDKFDIYRE